MKHLKKIEKLAQSNSSHIGLIVTHRQPATVLKLICETKCDYLVTKHSTLGRSRLVITLNQIQQTIVGQ